MFLFSPYFLSCRKKNKHYFSNFLFSFQQNKSKETLLCFQTKHQTDIHSAKQEIKPLNMCKVFIHLDLVSPNKNEILSWKQCGLSFPC